MSVTAVVSLTAARATTSISEEVSLKHKHALTSHFKKPGKGQVKLNVMRTPASEINCYNSVPVPIKPLAA